MKPYQRAAGTRLYLGTRCLKRKCGWGWGQRSREWGGGRRQDEEGGTNSVRPITPSSRIMTAYLVERWCRVSLSSGSGVGGERGGGGGGVTFHAVTLRL